MPGSRGAHLVELSRVFAGTPVARAWALKAAATRKARRAQLALRLAPDGVRRPSRASQGSGSTEDRMSGETASRLRMLDLFCGLGGASAAMRDRPLWEVVGVDHRDELDPDVCADISSWTYSGPRIDLVWASPPCAEFAKTDKRCWYPDAPAPSMALVEAALRIIEAVKPRWWLLENVRGARRWFASYPELGAPVLQSPPLYLWGRPPPGLLLPSPGAGHKEYQSRRSSDARALRLSSDDRRRQLRAVVPYCISYAVARACEKASRWQPAPAGSAGESILAVGGSAHAW